MKALNLVGRQIGRLRYARNWTQEMLAEALDQAGWPLTRSGVSKIEGGAVYVPDFRLLYLSRVLGVEVEELLPKIDRNEPLHEVILRRIRLKGGSIDFKKHQPLEGVTGGMR
jgi:transcriptional regulator with XRE-family HTH domain